MWPFEAVSGRTRTRLTDQNNQDGRTQSCSRKSVLRFPVEISLKITVGLQKFTARKTRGHSGGLADCAYDKGQKAKDRSRKCVSSVYFAVKHTLGSHNRFHQRQFKHAGQVPQTMHETRRFHSSFLRVGKPQLHLSLCSNIEPDSRYRKLVNIAQLGFCPQSGALYPHLESLLWFKAEWSLVSFRLLAGLLPRCLQRLLRALRPVHRKY